MRSQSNLLLVLAGFLMLAVVSSCTMFRGNQPPPLYEGPWYFKSVTFDIAPISSMCMPDPQALERFRTLLHKNQICHRSKIRFLVQDPPKKNPFAEVGMIWSSWTQHV